jgi:alpha-tubulin suppressor-like RCC1 family protein
MRLADFKIEEFAAGAFHTLALSNEGVIFAFGNKKHDKLGFVNRSVQEIQTG